MTSLIALMTVFALIITAVVAATPPTAYKNHTVGGAAGWFFNATTNTAATNYSAWAATETFNLGDYLIFKTNSNVTVFQTYNETTFRNCSGDDASDDDTFQYAGGNPAFSESLTIPVPLTIEGNNYYFSDGNDGVQCLNGMAFEIVVSRGLGLPPSLNQPPPPPYKEPPGPDSPQSPPININGGSPSLDNGALRLGGLKARVGMGAVILAVTVLLVVL